MRGFAKRRYYRSLKSTRAVSQILAEVLMTLIVLIMVTIVFAYASGLLGQLLTGQNSYPEDFTVIGASSPFPGGFNASLVQPTPGGNPHFNTGYPLCTGTINGGTAGNLLVPPGANCTINDATVQSVYVNYGASLTINGGSLQAINDNRSASIVVTNNALLQGGMYLYGTQSFSMTGSHAASGAVIMDGVMYATYSSNTLGATITVKNGGSAQFDSNTISGTVTFTNDQVVRLTNNTINGTLTFSSDPNCYQANNIVSGTITGVCTGGAPTGGLDILNTGKTPISFVGLYLNSQIWSGVSWQLTSSSVSTEQCGGNTVSSATACTLMTIVIPPGVLAHVSFSWVNPNPSLQVRLVMWTLHNDYLDARTDTNLGLVCSTRSLEAPRATGGYC